jgi:heat shock protein HslJ
MGATSEPARIMLENTEWQVASLSGFSDPVPATGRPLTLRLESATKRVSGFAGVNRIQGSYELNGSSLRFGPLAATRMAGPPDAMAREAAFLNALEKVSRWKSGSSLIELLAGNEVVVMLKVP